jgi:hypothetical protein
VAAGGDGGAEAWWAESAAVVAAGDRARVAALRDQAAAAATLAGLFVDAAERRGAVTVSIVDGVAVRGEVCAVGRDFVGLRQGRSVTLVAFAAVSAVQADGSAAPGSAGGRAARGDTRLADVLAEAAADGQRVRVRARGGLVVQGRVRAASPELCEIERRGPGPPGSPTAPIGGQIGVHVAVAAVTEVVLLEG